jgi:hypothetical protein
MTADADRAGGAADDAPLHDFAGPILSFEELATALEQLVGHWVTAGVSILGVTTPLVIASGWLNRIERTDHLYAVCLRPEPRSPDERTWREGHGQVVLIPRARFRGAGELHVVGSPAPLGVDCAPLVISLARSG